jgi:hypothetical protein
MKENENTGINKAVPSKNNHVSGMFKDRESAEKAYHSIKDKGYAHEHIHVLMSPETHQKHFSTDKHSSTFDTHNTKHSDEFEKSASEGAKDGAAIGIGLGVIIGAIAAMGTTVLIPGLGILIAGPFAMALLAGGAGGITGGLIGALVGVGIPEKHARKYEHGLKNGHIVLSVKPLNEQDAVHIESEWTKHNGIEINRD